MSQKVFFSSLMVFILSFTLFSNHLLAQDKQQEKIETGIKKIYNLQFQEANAIFSEIIKQKPNDPTGYFFVAMIDWWKILVDTDNASFDEGFLQKLEKVIEIADKALDKNPDDVSALFFKGGSIGFRGRLYALRREWVSAANDGVEALPIVNRAFELDPANLDISLGFGIYDYYAAVIPERYPIVQPFMFMFPEGDRKRGIKELELVAKSGKYAKYESRYFLMTLYFHYEKNFIKAEEYANMLIKDFPDNPTFERWQGRIAARRNQLEKYSEIFTSVLTKCDKGLYGYFDTAKREALYYVGLYHKNKSNKKEAKQYFEKCIALSEKIDEDEESGFQVNATMYLAELLESSNPQKAIMLYEKVEDMEEFRNSHEKAEQKIERLKRK